jgi:menaquinone-specific isochorismate synthase
MDMLAPIAILEQLEARLDDALARLPARAPSGSLQSVLLALPRAPAAAPQLAGRQFQFQHGQRGELHAGYGDAAVWQADGAGRFGRLAELLATRTWLRDDPDETGFDAFAMLGFAADDDASAPPAPAPRPGLGRAGADALPSALLWVPEIGIVCRDHEAALVFSTALPADRQELRPRWRAALRQLVPALYAPLTGPLTPARLRRTHAEPRRAGWDKLVQAALASITSGAVEKLVVSRRLEVTGPREYDIGRLLGALGCLFPSCQTLSLRRSGQSFVAATPERLLSLRAGWLEVDAIAGTAARAERVEDDAALRAALLGSDKNLREHRVVIDAIGAALADCCDGLEAPERPQVMLLNNAQHLWSPITARPRAGIGLLELARRLHPTPATNGQPRADAQAWRRRAEPFARGWYTGAAGIVRPNGDGELWVLLRCAHVSGARAELFAGAGIVEGSDPASEWNETEAKLAAMLSALQYA